MCSEAVLTARVARNEQCHPTGICPDACVMPVAAAGTYVLAAAGILIDPLLAMIINGASHEVRFID